MLKRDIYFYVLEASWNRVFLFFFSLYLVSNLFFATLFYLIPQSLIGMDQVGFWDAFYFSVQTMSTIGYGTLAPQGHLANILVTIEAAFGLIGVAIITGLIFAKISRPVAKIRFSKNLVLSSFDGKPCLSFRMGNVRGNDIVEAKVNVSALIDEVTSEGHHFRRIYNLPLVRSFSPFFSLTWSLFHEIDEHSPLMNFQEVKKNLKAIAVTVTGHDGTFSTTVYGRHLYDSSAILEGKYFKDIMREKDLDKVSINYEDFDTII